ncbi:MAG: aldolase/citrate lyase family protein [Clostridia bacterium]|nr:aldolase/citrate lyase family protein [Clostridia bacterium]MDR3644230.1 aldolase/citrate lyase family protein [Clostridia bacterium]
MKELEKIRAKLRSGEPVIGTCVNYNDSCITEQLGLMGYDFVWIDMEHTGNDKREVLQHIIAAKAAGTASFVRIPWNDPVLAKPILEMGPDGIIFPFIRSVAEAKQAISSCLYPPRGRRGFGPIRAAGYGVTSTADYIEGAADSIFKMIQIEHIDAVDCMEEIVKIEGIDALVIGPMDLSGSLGKLGEVRGAKVLSVMDRIGEIGQKSGIPMMLAFGYSPVDIEDWISRGIRMISVNSDIGFIASAGAQTLRATKEMFIKKQG